MEPNRSKEWEPNHVYYYPSDNEWGIYFVLRGIEAEVVSQVKKARKTRANILLNQETKRMGPVQESTQSVKNISEFLWEQWQERFIENERHDRERSKKY
jgi:hypothetical protein